MIIHCNDKQRTSIYHNRKYILINDTNCSYKLGPFHKLLLVCIWCAVYMMGGIVFAINLDKIGLLLYTIGSYMAVSFMTIKILTCRYIHRKLKSIQRNEKLSINGATITRVNPKYGVFEYVEDDVKDIEQKKYINEGNIFTKRTKNLEVGQRLIILYGLDHVFEKTYVMMPENEMLSLIPASSPDVDLNKLESYNDELDTYKNNVINTVANPSCAKIRKDEYYISEEEKKKIITSNYLEIELKQIKKIFLICGIMIGLGTNTFVGIITVVNTLPIIFTVLLFIIANVAVALFL